MYDRKLFTYLLLSFILHTFVKTKDMEVKERRNALKEEIDRKAEERYKELMGYVRQFRESEGITLADLSVSTQIYPSYLHRVETGSISTSVPKLITILEALGLRLAIESIDKNN